MIKLSSSLSFIDFVGMISGVVVAKVMKLGISIVTIKVYQWTARAKTKMQGGMNLMSVEMRLV